MTPVRRIARARVRGRDELVDIDIDGATIAVVRPAGDGDDGRDASVVDAAGRLVVPGLVEAHLHLEKAFLLDRMPRPSRSLSDAMAITAELKADFTPGDMRRRALRALRRVVSNGVTSARCHVEVDDVLGLSAIEAMAALREEVAPWIDLQIAVFPQDGIASQRRVRGLMRDALAAGADVIGGIPYADEDRETHLDDVFDLAIEHDRDIDFHIDLSDDPDDRDILGVIRRTTAAGWQGRVAAGHLTALGSVPAGEARDICAGIAEAGIGVVALPVTDAFLGGRGDAEAPRRGLTPVGLLHAAGADVAVATNNIQNPFTPFGRGRILDAALMLAALCHFSTAEDADRLVDMMTVVPRRIVGAAAVDIAPGAPADFAVFDAATSVELLNDCVHPDVVLKSGRIADSKEMPR